MYLKDDLAEEYVEVMDLPDTEIPSMTFRDAYHYADLIFSQDFEGIDNDLDLTKEQNELIGLTQKFGLTRPIDSREDSKLKFSAR